MAPSSEAKATVMNSWLLPSVASVMITSYLIKIIRNKLHRRTPLMELASVLKTGETDAEVEKYKKTWESKIKAVKERPTEQQELEMLDCSPTPRFAPDDPAMLEFLEENGYAVVKGAAGQHDVERLHGLLWDFLELHTAAGEGGGAGGWKRNDASTWSDEGMSRIGSCSVGILNGLGVGHSEFLWASRELPNVLKAFHAIWDTTEVATSFDGGNIFRPYSWPPPKEEKVLNEMSMVTHRRTQGGWWHVDQGATKVGRRHSVQGLLSLFDSDATTGGLCVMPRSHRRHTELLCDVLGKHVVDSSDHAANADARDFASVPPYFPGFKAMPRRLVCCKAGDLVLWDSRTFHCNTPAPKPKTSSETMPAENKLLRAVAYICMTPSRLLDDASELRQQRRAAYEGRITTSHWPHILNMGTPGVGCAGETPLVYSSASPLRRALVG
mmetsp:Transcript_59077/g.115898  ORF Transcript_59077/g.115898 Transcript_59077/m.115898 type:complete len:440 (-) Transcript_59077:10-1329(-)